MERQIIKECKESIERAPLEHLQHLYITYLDAENAHEIAWDLVFKDVYLHACLKKKEPIMKWLEDDVFKNLDPLQQIALKPTFAYGRHLFRK